MIGPPMATLLDMISGGRISRTIYVTAELGIADLLKNGPRSVDELARETGALEADRNLMASQCVERWLGTVMFDWTVDPTYPTGMPRNAHGG
jgi:hypothetical protein